MGKIFSADHVNLRLPLRRADAAVAVRLLGGALGRPISVDPERELAGRGSRAHVRVAAVLVLDWPQ